MKEHCRPIAVTISQRF